MAETAKALHAQVIEEHHDRLERIAEKRGVSRLKRVYEDAHAEVEAKLKRLVRSGKGSTYEAHQHRMVLAQVIEGERYVTRRMKGELGDAAFDARSDVMNALTRDLSRLEKKFTGTAPVLPIEDVARFQGVLDKRSTSLLARHDTSLDKYGKRTVVKIEGELSKSLLMGESPNQAIDRVSEVIDGQWWEAERIVRTELMHASNATQADAIADSRKVMPDIMMQWVEMVSDRGSPLDDRVGVDSLALHGQVTAPGRPFTCPARAPNGKTVSDSLAYEEIDHPPNRPNDRATIVPWRPGWGIYGWKYVNGRRIQVK